MDPNKSDLSDSKNKTNLLQNVVYYGVYTPSENKYFPDDFNSTANVFQDKAEALKLAKKNKKSRFKAFQFYHEAAEFAMNGSEFPNNNTTVDGPFCQKKVAEVQQFNEKVSPFKGPKPQELVEFRKMIEAGNVKAVRDTIMQNPRYLVSSGDTPAILQEGSRYNALHVSTKAKNAEITALILDTIADAEFVKFLYGDDNQENAEDRTKMLVDLYLNTPNKGLNETPLHFASKYGAADVVEVLVSYPQLDKLVKNKFGKTAAEIICERAEGETPATRKKIELLLQDNYYVPVLRTEDNSLPPIIGEPFSPTSPPVLNKNLLCPRVEMRAYAGPMDRKCAEEFRKAWKTPPRSRVYSKISDCNLGLLRFKDPDKGLERIGKKLANLYGVSWSEYWPFFNDFIDITSEQGLNLLEKRLASFNTSPCEKKTKSENSLSPISNLCNNLNSCYLNGSANRENSADSEINPLLYIDVACIVFANRISNDIQHILCGEYNNIAPVLENEVKQLELLITSYMDDAGFSHLNYQKVHSRLGRLVGDKICHNIKEEKCVFLCTKLNNLLESMTKSLDYFSSDDEGNHVKDDAEIREPTSYKKQLICLVTFILNVLISTLETMKSCTNDKQSSEVNPNQYIKEWEEADECPCIYHMRKAKKNNALSRSSSQKNRKFMATDVEVFSRKLVFNDSHNSSQLSQNDSGDLIDLELSSDEEEDKEEFYTPPSSPCISQADSDEEEFNDTHLPKNEIFIEGFAPTKTDCTVFNALKTADCQIDRDKYPNIYRWRHNVGLYPESERESWPNQNLDSTLPLNDSWSNESLRTSTPRKSWLRITGVYSPRASKCFNN